MTDPIARLKAAGVSVWLDDLSRERLTSGSLAALARDRGVSGVTTNPTIFARSITGSDAYAGQIRDLRLRQAGPGQALRELTTFDVRWACDVLRPVYESGNGVDGRVSVEADPRIARDTDRTVAEARALWWLVSTMPEDTLNAVAGHGDIPGGRIYGTCEQSRAARRARLGRHRLRGRRSGPGRPGGGSVRRQLGPSRPAAGQRASSRARRRHAVTPPCGDRV